MDFITKVYILFLSLVSLFGCVHNEYVHVTTNPNSNLPYDVSVGDNVRVITVEAESIEFQLTGITEKSLIGDGIEIPYQEIQMLQAREVDSVKTVAGTSAAGVVLVNLAIIAALALTF